MAQYLLIVTVSFVTCLTKAFHLVNHDLTLQKWHRFGVREIPLNYMTSYWLYPGAPLPIHLAPLHKENLLHHHISRTLHIFSRIPPQADMHHANASPANPINIAHLVGLSLSITLRLLEPFLSPTPRLSYMYLQNVVSYAQRCPRGVMVAVFRIFVCYIFTGLASWSLPDWSFTSCVSDKIAIAIVGAMESLSEFLYIIQLSAHEMQGYVFCITLSKFCCKGVG